MPLGPATLGGWNRKITWVQEVEASLVNTREERRWRKGRGRKGGKNAYSKTVGFTWFHSHHLYTHAPPSKSLPTSSRKHNSQGRDIITSTDLTWKQAIPFSLCSCHQPPCPNPLTSTGRYVNNWRLVCTDSRDPLTPFSLFTTMHSLPSFST